jgi:hypothetical protein
MKWRAWSFALVVVGTVAPAAGATQGRIELAIAAGRADEVCMPLKAGTTLAWNFDASAPVDFNLHRHRGAQVLMPVERKAVASDRAAHRVDATSTWCLMWTAPPDRGATVSGQWSTARR